MVNCAGDTVTGFSGSGATNFVSAYCHWRLADGTELRVPGLLWAGIFVAGTTVWGDYSATSLDPSDDWSFVSVQEIAMYVGTDASANVGTVVGRFRPGPK
jgi:hypothetical protein